MEEAKALQDLGVAVPDAAIDEHGYTHPRLTTLPMGWKPSPGIAQGAREAVLYGAFGRGSMRARSLLPVLDPAARWSSTRVPKLDTPEASAPHALVVDDVLLFRMVPRAARRHRRARGGVPLSKLLRRYDEVNLRTKPSKVHDYDVEQDLLGYRLERNVLRSSLARYSELKRSVATLCARGWQEPHEVEATVARFTHAFLLHRFALSVFSAAYVFSQQHGDRRARVWPSVLRELRAALAEGRSQEEQQQQQRRRHTGAHQPRSGSEEATLCGAPEESPRKTRKKRGKRGGVSQRARLARRMEGATAPDP